MMIIIVTLHVIACVGLIFFVLIQQGKGGGLIESFSSAENIFGSKTSTFLVKTTTTMAIVFFCTCLLLAFTSAQRSKSVIRPSLLKQKSASQSTNKLGQTKQEASAASTVPATTAPATTTAQKTEQPQAAAQAPAQPTTQEQTQTTQTSTQKP